MTKMAYEAATIIRARAPNFQPQLAIVLGSGLGALAEQIDNAVTISYSELPGFHKPKTIGHAGNLLLGTIQDIPVVCLQGRAHYYDGVDNNVIKTMVRTVKLIGCDTWLATNAAGSLRSEVGPGSLVLLKDHINFQFNNALIGNNDADFGPRFVPMEEPYNFELRQRLFAIAKQLTINLTEGVYIGVIGPSFETPAEINAYRILGADCVGMSTVPEVIVARHCGMRVAVISVITNYATGMRKQPLSHEETLREAHGATEKLIKLVTTFITQYHS